MLTILIIYIRFSEDKNNHIKNYRIIADCGYGVAGGPSDNCKKWNAGNKAARIKDGVIALTSAIKAAPPADMSRPNV